MGQHRGEICQQRGPRMMKYKGALIRKKAEKLLMQFVENVKCENCIPQKVISNQ